MGKLAHTLNGVVIEEPIGFDQLKTTIKRGDYHGMSVEVSVGELEFYGEAARMITEAYNTDIDTELAYVVKTQDGMVLYQGVVDLTTYNEKKSEYRSVAVSVGEVGIKTTFNNRSDVEIDLNSDKTFDGEELAHKPEWKSIKIPSKTIRYVNEMVQKVTTAYTSEPATGNVLQLPDDFQYAWINIGFDTLVKNESGSVAPLLHLAQIASNSDVSGYADPMYSSDENLNPNAYIYANGKLQVQIKLNSEPFTHTGTTPKIDVEAALFVNGNQYRGGTGTISITNDNYSTYKYRNFEFNLSDIAESIQTIHIGLLLTNYNKSGGNFVNNRAGITLQINAGSEFKMNIDDSENTPVSTKVMLIHEAINKVVESITNNEITVKSNLYQRFDSIVNQLPFYDVQTGEKQFGDGSLKAITNGYKIRGLFSDQENERNMSVSFKDMIENLNSIDCLGYGFSNEEGQQYMRVERWDWFYQNNKLLEITSPNEVTRKMDDGNVITELKIGYKKYSSPEDISSIDSVHSERTFTTTTKALSKSNSKLCDFIADNYAIEETRRAAISLDPEEEFKYDENIFIFSLGAQRRSGNYTSCVYFAANDVANDVNKTFLKPNEMYNTLISPTRNAFRWISRLFCVQGLKPFQMIKGTVNYKAAFTTKESGDAGGTGGQKIFYTPDPMRDIVGQSEDIALQEVYGNIVIPRVFKAEEVSLKYPISIEQYQAIKDNPYGLIVVDGEECWIKEFQYDFNTSEAEFKLTPKA